MKANKDRPIVTDRSFTSKQLEKNIKRYPVKSYPCFKMIEIS